MEIENSINFFKLANRIADIAQRTENKRNNWRFYLAVMSYRETSIFPSRYWDFYDICKALDYDNPEVLWSNFAKASEKGSDTLNNMAYNALQVVLMDEEVLA